MSERFFITTPPDGDRAVLAGDEARHLTRVLRAKVGDTVSLFDGTGREWPARVASLGRDRVELDTGKPAIDSLPSEIPLTLAVALPKGDRQKWMVEKLTELGAARLIPLETARGDGMVDEIVMLAPALSPGYDLSAALRRVRGRVWVFWSPGDPALGQMTRMFGTIDRVQSEAAGRVGFRRPAGADAAQYAKVMSVPYDPAWQRDDNFGDHVGPMSAGFARGMIAPLLEGRRAPTTRPIEGPAPAP